MILRDHLETVIRLSRSLAHSLRSLSLYTFVMIVICFNFHAIRIVKCCFCYIIILF